MAPIPTPIGYPIGCGLTLICAVCGDRLGAGTARCRDPGVGLLSDPSIHPSRACLHAARTCALRALGWAGCEGWVGLPAASAFVLALVAFPEGRPFPRDLGVGLGTPTSGRLHRPVASSSLPLLVGRDVQRMVYGAPIGARDCPPLPIKRGGGAAEPLGVLVPSAQRESFPSCSPMQLPLCRSASSGVPCRAASHRAGGGLPFAQCPHPCPRPLRPASCALPPGMPPLCTISPSPRCCPSVFACGVRCGVCAWTDIARVCSSRPVPTCEGPVCRAPAPASAQDLQLP